MTKAYGAIIIGAGINGLVTAAYLAKAGLRVLVLERRDRVGGVRVTEEAYPGFRFDTCAHDTGWLNPAIIRDLALARHPLEFIQPDPTVCAPSPDGGGLALWRDVDKSVEAIRRFSKSDADRWPAFSTRMAKLAGFLKSLYAITPPSITTTNPVELLTLLGLGRRLRGLGRQDMIELVRALPMSVDELLNDWFETDVLKGVLGAGGITGLMQGPRASGTAYVFLHHQLGSPAGTFRSIGLVRGGIGNLANAISAAARQHGVEIRLSAEVAHILVKADRVSGVVLRDGEEIGGRRVVSAVDPRRTFFELLDPLRLDPNFVRAVQNIKYRNARAKVNLALSELPHFDGLDPAHLRGAISISPSLDYLEHAYDDAKHGGLSRRPYLEAIIPSLSDPTLAPPGRHVMSIWMQHAPYRLKDGAWDDRCREALGDLVVNTLAEYAPQLKASMLYRQVLTPLDLENTFGLTEGQLDHGELTLDQILFMRPVPGWAKYRTPMQDLYLCGPGTHPGGGVAGGSGYHAAREILKDVKRVG
ncbi:MAG TPA: NAD(P)/FAD-dependent oxidoreductase [Anaerolineae bacterium]|nr:NAD(P)/FAD-dependent oxidoreductase [Anaerolineae bacterium]